MTDPEDFLSRWSRRKRQAKVEPEQPKADDAAAPDNAQSETASQHPSPARAGDGSPRDATAEDIFDISKLPSLDSIGAATDIRMFLQPGVPEALSRAALRRAWSADPGIRDFIGLAENAWDFTASDGMHGFGELDPADAKRLLAELFKEIGDKEEIAADDAAVQEGHHEGGTDPVIDPANDPKQVASGSLEAAPASAGDETPGSDEPAAVDDAAMLQDSNSAPDFIATQQKQPEPALLPMPVRRTHGRALPE